MPTSPSNANYRIAKGIVSFKETGESVFRDVGNCPAFTYTPNVTKKEHFSSREGILKKDATYVTQVGATITFTMDEITGENLAYFALADVDTNSSGDTQLLGLSKTEFTGDIKVVGTNEIGQQVDFTAKVSFTPSGDFAFVTDTDDFNVIEVEAEVLVGTNGEYGTWTIRDTASV